MVDVGDTKIADGTYLEFSSFGVTIAAAHGQRGRYPNHTRRAIRQVSDQLLR